MRNKLVGTKRLSLTGCYFLTAATVSARQLDPTFSSLIYVFRSYFQTTEYLRIFRFDFFIIYIYHTLRPN